MSQVISGYHNTSQSLTASSGTIAGTIVANGSFAGDGSTYSPVYAAVYAGGSGNFTVTQPGIIDDPSTAASRTAVGIFLGAPSQLTNQGSIYGHSEGVLALGGTIFNSGLIAGAYNAVRLAAPGLVNNSGTIEVLNEQTYFSLAPGAIELTQGGSVSNSGTIISKNAGIVAISGVANVNNSGLIEGDGGTFLYGTEPLISAGISLLKGGTVTNHGTVLGTGPGIEAAGLASVLNYGTIASTGTGFGIAVDLRGGGDLLNDGIIENANAFPSILIEGGGSVDNRGVVGGYIGAYFYQGSGSFSNSGTVAVTAQAIRSYADFSVHVTNSGLLSAADATFSYYLGSYVGAGVDLRGGGRITNTGTIVGGGAGVIAYGATSIVNSGIIAGDDTGQVSVQNPDVGALTLGVAGIDLLGGGAVVNKSSGNITGYTGAFFSGSAKLTNDGTITGTHGVAVYFAGASSLLRVGPGAVFNGKVIDHAGDGTLELGSGTEHGQITGLGTDFLGFSKILVDSSANWTLTGSNQLGGGQVLLDDGTLSTAGRLSIANRGLEIVSQGASASGTTVDSGGLQIVSGGRTEATTVNSGGAAIVLLGGTTDGNILAGGDEILSLGANAFETTIGRHAQLVVAAGGTADDTTISGGTELLERGALVRGAVTFKGNQGTLAVEGTDLPKNLLTGFDANAATGDAIVLAGFSYTSSDTVTLGANNALTLDLSGTIETLHFDLAQSFATNSFALHANSQDQVVIINPTNGLAAPGMVFLGSPASKAAFSLGHLFSEIADAKSALPYVTAGTSKASAALSDAFTLAPQGIWPEIAHGQEAIPKYGELSLLIRHSLT